MIIKNNKEATDSAWERLYSRLEREQLLDTAPVRRPLFPVVVWSMSLAAVLVVGLFVIRNYTAPPKENIIVVNTSSDDSDGAFLAAMLNDGSVVYIADSATLSYPSTFDDNKREVMLSGTAFFDVRKNAGKPFFVETDYASIEVIGTMFGVRSFKAGGFKVLVSSGEVRVTLKNSGQCVNLKAGEGVALEDGSLRMTDDEQALAFEPYSGKIYCKDMYLSDIVNVVNKQNGEKRLMAAPEVGTYVLTATFTKDDPAIIANVICKALNLRFSYQEDMIIIHE